MHMMNARDAGIAGRGACGLDSDIFETPARAMPAEAGLVNNRSVAHNHPNKTPTAFVEKVLHLRRKYHLAPMRIVRYLERYHGIRISDAGVYRVPCRNGLNRLSRGAPIRKVRTKRYNNQVPRHHIQMDIKFLTFKGKGGKKIRRFQDAAIDGTTRIQALKI